ncbi:MAG: DUF2279 domain-containing protein [Chitinophagaceae bacterium]|nr:DUF2279 domain-containing protein [Chitinophagaceae bacterium]
MLLVTLFISNNSWSQADSCNSIDTSNKDQLELSTDWGGGHGGEPGVTFNNFSIYKISGNKNWDLLDSSSGKFLKWDTLKKNRLTPQQKKRRTWIIGAGNIVGYSTAMIGLYSAWYKDYPQTSFHSFNDWPEWKQVDKVGHLYSAYVESRGSMELWRWTGIDRKKRIWIGGMSGAFYQTVIEVLDGFSAEWGWSWADFGANILGSGMLVAQELAWDDQRIKLKFSFHKKTYDDPQLNQRSDVLFGKGAAERFLKDYNGQTYWASINLKPFLKNDKFPAWLSIAVGYGAEGMFGGTENLSKDPGGNITFSRPDIKRYRQWYLSPDIDLSKIKTKSKALNFIFTFLSAFKFPMPSIEFSNGKFKAHAIHF